MSERATLIDCHPDCVLGPNADHPGYLEYRCIDGNVNSLPFPGEERVEVNGRTEFATLDSGERVDFPSGMRRDTDKGKPRFDLIPLPMLRRLADLYARGAEKYGDANWTLADSPEEVARFKASAFRHFVSWLEGDITEDHAVATVFNVFAAETIAAKIADA